MTITAPWSRRSSAFTPIEAGLAIALVAGTAGASGILVWALAPSNPFTAFIAGLFAIPAGFVISAVTVLGGCYAASRLWQMLGKTSRPIEGG